MEVEKKYVAVGFSVQESRSIFYFKQDDLDRFLELLGIKIRKTNPDFVSLRMIKKVVKK